MKYILCADTSSMTSCVALGTDDGKLLEGRVQKSKSHGPGLMGLISDVLEKTNITIRDISYFVSGNGPGTFTGVRIGLTTLKTLAWALEKPLFCITSFEILKKLAPHEKSNIVVLIDARRNECYTDFLSPDKTCEGRLVKPEEIVDSLTNIQEYFLVGTGTEAYSEILFPLLKDGYFENKTEITPEILFLAACDRIKTEPDNTVTAQPLYIRPPDAEISVKHRPVSI